jgi:hypothetical protein
MVKHDLISYVSSMTAVNEDIPTVFKVWVVQGFSHRGSKFFENNDNTTSVFEQSKVLKRRGFVFDPQTQRFSFPGVYQNTKSFRLVTNQAEADVLFKRTVTLKTTQLLAPVESKLRLEMIPEPLFYLEPEIELGFKGCGTPEEMAAYTFHVFFTLYKTVNIFNRATVVNKMDDSVELQGNAIKQLIILLCVVNTDQLASVISQSDMPFNAAVTRIFTALITAVQEDGEAIIWANRPADYIGDDYLAVEANPDQQNPAGGNAGNQDEVAPVGNAGLAAGHNQDEDQDPDILTEAQLLELEGLGADEMGDEVFGIGNAELRQYANQGRPNNFQLQQYYHFAARSVYGTNQVRAKGFRSLGVRSYNMTLSGFAGARVEAFAHDPGFPEHITQQIEDWDVSVLDVIQYVAKLSCLFTVFVDVRLRGLGVLGGPNPAMRVSRLGISKASVDALLMLALTFPDLACSTASEVSSTSDWILESSKYGLSKSLSFSGAAGQTIRQAISQLEGVSQSRQSVEDIFNKIFRVGETQGVSSNICTTMGRATAEPSLSPSEPFKLYLVKDQILRLRDVMHDHIGALTSQEFKDAIRQCQLDMAYYLPTLRKSGSHYVQLNKEAYALQYNTPVPVIVQGNATDEVADIICKYRCAFDIVDEELEAPGTIARHVETAVKNSPLVISVIDDDRYAVRSAHPLEFLMKSLCLRRLNTVVKSKNIDTTRFLGAVGKEEARKKFQIVAGVENDN